MIATPRCVPTVGNEDIDFTIVCKEFGELVLDQLDLLRRDIEVTNVVALREYGVVKSHAQTGGAKGIDIGANYIDLMIGLSNARGMGLRRPDAEAVMIDASSGSPTSCVRISLRQPTGLYREPWD